MRGWKVLRYGDDGSHRVCRHVRNVHAHSPAARAAEPSTDSGRSGAFWDKGFVMFVQSIHK